MNKRLKQATIGALLIGIGAGAATIPAYKAGRDSAKPQSVSITKTTSQDYKFLENVVVTDASGRITAIHDYGTSETVPIHEKHPKDGYLVIETYRSWELRDSMQRNSTNQ
ncbi:MAG: hypothetical protein ABIA93_01540 [Candidatus Woesearchaeota archaeon]